MEANSPLLIIERPQKAIQHITLNRPGSLNCLSLEMIAALQSALDEAKDDTSIRAIILSGSGPGFCAGHDLKEIASHKNDTDGGRAYYETLFNNCTQMMLTIASLPVPVIAQVHRVAAAAGCQLVATCDMAIADDQAQFAVNGIDAGLFCSTPQVALSRNIPRKAAMEMLMLGERISAERALSLGLLNRIVPKEELEKTTLDFAERAAQKSRKVIALGKQAFYRQVEMTLTLAYEDMSNVIVDNLMMEDARCGIDAFINKEKPEWNND